MVAAPRRGSAPRPSLSLLFLVVDVQKAHEPSDQDKIVKQIEAFVGWHGLLILGVLARSAKTSG